MKNLKNIVVIPVFNDWKSLNKLLKNLQSSLKGKIINVNILIINDKSSEDINISKKNLNYFKKIEVLTLARNVGSQKAIATGLLYLKKIDGNFIITVMDSDGEDDPNEVLKMIRLSSKNPNYVITSNRKSREESKIIIFLYYIHLILTFLFTFKWISFGNFTSFHKKNLSKLFKDKSAFYAHSSAVMKNCLLIRKYAKRKKRYFDKSKLSIFSLAEHSLRVNAVFYKNIILSSFLYLILACLFFSKNIFFLFLILILVFNILILYIKLKHKENKIPYLKHLLR